MQLFLVSLLIATAQIGIDLPALKLRHAPLKIERNDQGRVVRLRLTDGDVVSYSYDVNSSGLVLAARAHGLSNGQRSILLPLETGDLYHEPHLSPWRLPTTWSELEGPSRRIRSEAAYPEFKKAIQPAFLAEGRSAELSASAITGIERQIDAITLCAPGAADLLTGLLSAGRIRHAPGVPGTAEVDFSREPTIYLSTLWVRALEDRGFWDPTAHLFRDGDEDARIWRETYFGTSAVSLATLGDPSRTWRLTFALLREAGQVLQNERADSDLAREVFGFDLHRVSKLIAHQEDSGKVDPALRRVQTRLEGLHDGWNQAMKRGATFFALDALAGCPAALP